MNSETIKTVAIWMMLIPAVIVIVPNILVPFDHWCSGTHEFSPEARYQRKLRKELRIWTNIMISCDAENEYEDYAYAAQRVEMLRRELTK